MKPALPSSANFGQISDTQTTDKQTKSIRIVALDLGSPLRGQKSSYSGNFADARGTWHACHVQQVCYTQGAGIHVSTDEWQTEVGAASCPK